MLSRDIAELYNVTARVLNQQVKRNRRRFPPDFVFQLTDEEAEEDGSRFSDPRGHGEASCLTLSPSKEPGCLPPSCEARQLPR